MKPSELIGICARYLTNTPPDRDADPAACVVVIVAWLDELVERGAIPRPTFTAETFTAEVQAGLMGAGPSSPKVPLELTRAVAYSTLRKALNDYYGYDTSKVGGLGPRLDPAALESAIGELFEKLGLP